MGAAVLSLAAVWFAARGVDRAVLMQTFGHVAWTWVALAALATIVSIVAHAVSWHLGLRGSNTGPVQFRHVLGASWMGKAVGQFVPGPSSELTRMMVIGRHIPGGAGQTGRLVGGLVAQSVFGGAATVLVVGISATVLPLPVDIPGGQLAFLCAVVGLCALGLALTQRCSRARLRRLVPHWVIVRSEPILAGLAVLRPSRLAAKCLALHLVAVSAQLAAMWLMMRGFGLDVPASAPPVLLAAMMIAGVLPATPGAVGVAQAAIVAPLGAAYGVANEIALAFAIGLHAMIASVAVIGGLGALVHQRVTRPQVSLT